MVTGEKIFTDDIDIPLISMYIQNMSRELPKNDLPTLILAVLGEEPRHGYAIARSIEARSEGILTAREGTLYPALRQLESEEFIESLWEHPTSGPARKVYRLTETGRAECVKRVAAWQKYADAIAAIVGGKVSEQPA